MGNYRFKLSDMMPNAWFYKLRDMGKSKNTRPVRKNLPAYPQRSSLSHPRHAAYYKVTETETDQVIAIDKFCTSSSFSNPKVIDTLRKPSSKRKTIYMPSPKLETGSSSTGCNCGADMLNSTIRDDPHPQPPPPVNCIQGAASFSSPDPEFFGSHSCRITASSTDIIIDVNNGKSFSRRLDNFRRFQYDERDSIPELELPPILTKPIKPKVVSSELEHERDDQTRKKKKKKKRKKKTTSNRSTTGIKLKANSPRIQSKKTNQISGNRQNMFQGFAIVKSSFDPQADFKDSMVEMVIENNIRASKDLEELLALYLSLNSDDYHDLIITAFEQIWYDIANLRL